MKTLEERIAALEVESANTKEDVREIKDDLKKITQDLEKVLRTLSEAKGSWKVLVILSSVSATIGGIVVKFIPWASMIR
jgi:uncharacterized phage protein gp47/JayE